jgi:NTP pyrophosphatase (non-canonical NTP hydrolase)
VGDLLFAVVSLANGLGIDAESVLRSRSAAFRQQVEAWERGACG